MINIIDFALVVIILFYFLRNAGGVTRIIKNVLVMLIFLILFGLLSALLLRAPLPAPVQSSFKDSYFVSVSRWLIKSVYPVVEQQAPKIDSFIKDEIMTAPTPEVKVPKVTLPLVPEK